MSSHRYSVQLRINGDIIPNDVTRELGLEPNHVRKAGTVVHGRMMKRSLWSYSGTSAEDFVQEWDTLEEGLLHLLNELAPKKEVLQRYIDHYDTVWWCGHFQSSVDGGPTFSKSLLMNLASFGVPVFIDNYFLDD
ncbi:DUF4279 domain-containing protein [Xanthomonas sp. NCPPB 2632]|uniref:DUF4279 domain-containing protein n=1 Tax=Xanthomonas sp. NCPPB 2632 TaxID=3240912 RepID=UPI00351122FE